MTYSGDLWRLIGDYANEGLFGDVDDSEVAGMLFRFYQGVNTLHRGHLTVVASEAWNKGYVRGHSDHANHQHQPGSNPYQIDD